MLLVLYSTTISVEEEWMRISWIILKQISCRPPRWAAPAAVAGRVPARQWEMGWVSSWRPACWLAAQARRCVARWRGTAAPALHGHTETAHCGEQGGGGGETPVSLHTIFFFQYMLKVTDFKPFLASSSYASKVCPSHLNTFDTNCLSRKGNESAVLTMHQQSYWHGSDSTHIFFRDSSSVIYWGGMGGGD